MLLELIKVSVALSIILGLLWMMKRSARQKQTSGPLKLIHRTPVSRSGAIVLVEAGDRQLLVGVTEDRMSVLTEFTGDDRVNAAAPAPPELPFASVLDSVRDRIEARLDLRKGSADA